MTVNSKLKTSFRILLGLILIIQASSACPQNCLDCDPSGNTCFACPSGYQMSVFGKCIGNKVQKCVLYGPDDLCFACEPSYKVQNGKCVKDFTGCINVNNNDGTCFECGFGKVQKLGKCINVFNCALPTQVCQQCLTGYQLQGTSVCKNVKPSCQKVRDADGLCQKCKTGYTLQGFECVQNSKLLKNCYVSTQTGTCIYCKRGFSFFNGQCRLPKDIEAIITGKVSVTAQNVQTSVVTASSQSSQLSQSSQSSQSSSQQSGNFNSGGFSSSFDSSPSTTVQTTSVTSSFTSSSNSNNNNGFSSVGPNQNDFNNNGGFSSDFPSGFSSGSQIQTKKVQENKQSSSGSYKNGGFSSGDFSSSPSTPSIPKCVQIVNGKCVKCEQNYVSNQNGNCVYLSKACQSYDLSLGKCIVCLPTFQLVNEKCIDKHCSQSNEKSQCQKCQSGFNLPQILGDACVKLGCVEFSNGDCTRCASGFQLNAQKTCDQLPPTPPTVPIANCQVPNDRIPGTCLICVYGFYPKGNKCVQVSFFCDGHNVETGQCFKCKFNLDLNNGKCLDNNCQSYFSDTGKCQACKLNYAPSSDGVCLFNDPNCVSRIPSGRCQQCVNGFYVNTNGQCKSLPFGCKFANIIDGSCLQCKQGYRFKQFGVCQETPKIPNCQIISPQNNKVCQKCVYGYFPYQNQCKQVSKLCTAHDVTNGRCLNCKQGFRLNQNQGKCFDPYCLNQQEDNCAQCKNKFSLSLGKDNLSICQLKDVNCQSVSNNQCKQCTQGYYIDIQKTCSKLRLNCLQARPDGFCVRCESNYKQNSNGDCQKNEIYIPNPQLPVNSQPPVNPIPNPYYNNNPSSNPNAVSNQTTKRDPNCMQYQGNNCKKCSDRFFKNAQGQCQPVSVFCNGNDDQGRCLNCYPGYKLTPEGNCIISIPSDVNCKRMGSSGRCQQCYQSFYVDGFTGQCKRVSVFCKSSNILGQCTDCYPGYKLFSGQCKIFFQDPNCKKFQNEACLECSDRFYVGAQGKCSPVNSLCKAYNMLNGFCTECYQGYGLQNGNCIAGLITQGADANCRKSINGICQQCYNGYFINRINNNKCEQISKLCKSANLNTGQCTDCYPGYTLSAGKCLNDRDIRDKDPNCKKISQYNPSTCQECYQGYIVNANGLCQVLDPLCKGYNLQNGQCTDCYPGYTLTSYGRCIQQVVSSFNSQAAKDPYCSKFNNGKCLQCSSGYFLPKIGGNGICKQLNPLCKQSNKDTGSCTDCYSGYILADGNCVVAQQINIPYCQLPAGNGKCQLCINGYYSKNGDCTPVSILCGDYDKNSGKCTSCIPGYVLQRGECIYPALGFDANCLEYQGAYCSKCSRNFYLSNYICTSVDGRCIDFDYNKKQCKLCANGLKQSGPNCI